MNREVFVTTVTSTQRNKADDPSTDVLTLLKLGESDEPELWLRVAFNPACPEEIMKPSPNMADFLENLLLSNVDTTILTHNILSGPVWAKVVVATVTQDEAILNALAADPSASVKEAVAANVDVSVQLLDKLTDTALDLELFGLANVIASNLSTSSVSLTKLIGLENVDLFRLIARHPNVSSQVLTLLMKDPALEAAVASNPVTPYDLLIELAQSSSTQVQATVASNLSAPLNVLENLVWLNEPVINLALATNPNLTPKLYAALVALNNYDINVKLVNNVHLPVKLLVEVIDQDPALMLQAVYTHANDPLFLKTLHDSVPSTVLDQKVLVALISQNTPLTTNDLLTAVELFGTSVKDAINNSALTITNPLLLSLLQPSSNYPKRLYRYR